ncbi:MAG: tetratricopeptide repeat protein [Betaproteobacteria bacterium]|nr:tetratricopeptide repeat protein [Betaproteobacteria bacterium]
MISEMTLAHQPAHAGLRRLKLAPWMRVARRLWRAAGIRAGLGIALAFCSAAPVHAELLRGFSQNATDRQFDYYATDPHSVHRVAVVMQYHWQPALRCIAENRYVCAHNQLDFILRWVPDDPQALMLMSNLALRAHRPQDAKPYLQAALRYCPRCAAVRAVDAIFLANSGQTARAIGEYKKSLALNPQAADVHYDLGLALFSEKRYRLANEEAHRAYALGFTLPGLRLKLQGAGAWKPVELRRSNPGSSAPAEKGRG